MPAIDEEAFQRLMEDFQAKLVKLCHGDEVLASGLSFGDAAEWGFDVGRGPIELRAHLEEIWRGRRR